MTRNIIIPLLAISALFLLTGCDQKLKEAQALGFNDAKEMEELTARGYATKDDYVDAVYRSPAFCNRGIFRLLPTLKSEGDHVITGLVKAKTVGRDAIREWAKLHCSTGTKVVWVVKAHFERSNALIGQSLEEEPRRLGDDEESEHLNRYDLEDQQHEYNLATTEFQKRRDTWFYKRDETFYLIDAIVEHENNDYSPFKLNEVRVVRELSADEVQPMLEELHATAAIKEADARAEGFQSVEMMLYSQSLGFSTENSMLTAARKAFEEGFESVPDQRAALEGGYSSSIDYYRHIQNLKEERYNDNVRRRQTEEAERVCREHADSGKENSFLQNVCELQGYHFFN
jgi:hypothetical protein